MTKKLIRSDTNGDRFQDFRLREWVSSLPGSLEFRESIQSAKWGRNRKAGVHWKGIRNLKAPWDLALYPMLLWELKPRTILEIGSFEGGSAAWMADILASMRLPCHIYSFDLHPEQVKLTHPNISFIRADSRHLSQYLDRRFLNSLPHPWLVIEDAHVNVFGVLRFFHQSTKKGDYMIVEDTIGREKHVEFSRFINKYTSYYKVDTHYTDNFGYNATWNWNGFLKRMK